jgi:hypothetical protein
MHVKQHILKYTVPTIQTVKENNASEEYGYVLTYAIVTVPRHMCNLKFFLPVAIML